MSTDDDIKRDEEYELKWDPDIDPSYWGRGQGRRGHVVCSACCPSS
ncbi:hypothetical protein [Paraburkholderia madseniana]|nr:hypothetical protein [Paraburkholderia madseniana]